MANGSWQGVWSAGQTVPASEMRKGVGDIYDNTLGTVTASLDSLAVIPSGYRQLRVWVQARSDTAATKIGLYLRLNHDSGATNYSWRWDGAGGGSNQANQGDGVAQIECGFIPAATAPGTSFGQTTIDIAYYGGTACWKMTGTKNIFYDAATASGPWQLNGMGIWKSTSAITRVEVLPAAGTLVANSSMTVYAWG